MIIGFTHRVRADIKEEIDSIVAGILNGGAKNFEEYRHMVGKKLGLETALAILDDAVRSFDEQQ